MVNYLGIVFVDHAPAHLERIGKFTVGHGEGRGQEHKAFDLLIVRQILLQGSDAFGKELQYLGVSAQVLASLYPKSLLAGELDRKSVV